jgi:cobalt-precorrin 5A hydrolase/precorrin-3B C17-methyltransferase
MQLSTAFSSPAPVKSFLNPANNMNLLEIEKLGIPYGWQQGSGDWAGVQAAIARQAPVQVIQEAGSGLWQTHLPVNHPFQFGFPDFDKNSAASLQSQPSPQARLWISPIQRRFALGSAFPKAQWHPRVLWVGIGYGQQPSQQQIEAAIQTACRAYHLAEAAIAGVATLQSKASDALLADLCSDRQWGLRGFASEDLRSIAVPHPSAIVEQATGTPSVSEAAAILAAMNPAIHDPASTLLRVSKQVFRPNGQPAVTVAIAQAVAEFGGTALAE